MLQQKYRGKQLHHLLYKGKAKEIQDLSQGEDIFIQFFLMI